MVDPEPDAQLKAPIRTYLHALRTAPPTATHRIVVQDDAVPGERFSERLWACIAERPDALVALFVPGWTNIRKGMSAAHARGEHWWAWPKYNWCPTVCLCWPVDLARDFIAYAEVTIEERARRGLGTIGDDPYVGAWANKRKEQVWCSVPSLVEHPDDVNSLFRPLDNGKPPKAGSNRARVAALFVG